MNTELMDRMQALLASFEPTLTWTKNRTCYVANNGATITWKLNGASKVWNLGGQTFATLKQAQAEALKIYREEN